MKLIEGWLILRKAANYSKDYSRKTKKYPLKGKDVVWMINKEFRD